MTIDNTLTDDEIFGANTRTERADLPENPFDVVKWQTKDGAGKRYHLGQVLVGPVVFEQADIPSTKKDPMDKEGKKRIPKVYPEGHAKAGQQIKHDLLYVLTEDGIKRQYIEGFIRGQLNKAKDEAGIGMFNTPIGMQVRIELTGTTPIGEGEAYDFDVKVKQPDPETKTAVVAGYKAVKAHLDLVAATLAANEENTDGKFDALNGAGQKSSTPAPPTSW